MSTTLEIYVHICIYMIFTQAFLYLNIKSFKTFPFHFKIPQEKYLFKLTLKLRLRREISLHYKFLY